MNTLDIESHLIGSIYDAALESTLWPQVMANIVSFTQANTATFFGMDALNPDYNFVFSHNVCQQNVKEYFEEGWSHIDKKVLGGALARVGVGVASTNSVLFGSFDNYKQAVGDFYHFLKKWNMTMQAGVLLEHSPFRWVTLGIHRAEEFGDFSPQTVAFLERIAPHLRRSLQIHRKLSIYKEQHQSLHQIFNSMHTGILLLNKQGDVAYSNHAMEQLLLKYPVLDIEHTGLKALDSLKNAELQYILKDTLFAEPIPKRYGGVLTLPVNPFNHHLLLTVVPFTSLALSTNITQQVSAAIFITDSQEPNYICTQVLQKTYHLTESEIRLCESFVNSPNLEQVAITLNLSLASVRTYIKSIYQKTQQHSQAELLKFLLGLKVNFEHIR